MKLADYLKREEISGVEFAKAIGVKPPTVYRYLEGQRIPRPEQMQRIQAVTNGAVGPADFYGPHPSASASDAPPEVAGRAECADPAGQGEAGGASPRQGGEVAGGAADNLQQGVGS